MKETDIELGKKLVSEHYKVGNWYKISSPNEDIYQCKYIKIEKIRHVKNMSERIFLKGKGFTTLKGALVTPSISKEEPVIFCWAEEYISRHPQLSETEVKSIFEQAVKKSFNNLFT